MELAAFPLIAAAAPAINPAFPAASRWSDKRASRPAVERGMTLMQALQ